MSQAIFVGVSTPKYKSAYTMTVDRMPWKAVLYDRLKVVAFLLAAIVGRYYMTDNVSSAVDGASFGECKTTPVNAPLDLIDLSTVGF